MSNPIPMPETVKYALARLLEWDLAPLAVRWTDRFGNDRLDDTDDPAEATDVQIPYTLSSEYGTGGFVERANLTFLAEEYEEILPLWVRTWSDYASALYLQTGALPGQADPEYWDALSEFLETVEALSEYPLACEETYSRVLHDATHENIESWAAGDLVREAERTLARYLTDPEEAEAERRAREILWEADVSPDCMGLNLYWPDWEDLIDALASEFPEDPSEAIHDGSNSLDSFRRRVANFNKQAERENLAMLYN